MNAREMRAYLPVTIAFVIVLMLIVLGYMAGYRAGFRHGIHAHPAHPATPR